MRCARHRSDDAGGSRRGGGWLASCQANPLWLAIVAHRRAHQFDEHCHSACQSFRTARSACSTKWKHGRTGRRDPLREYGSTYIGRSILEALARPDSDPGAMLQMPRLSPRESGSYRNVRTWSVDLRDRACPRTGCPHRQPSKARSDGETRRHQRSRSLCLCQGTRSF